MHIKVSLRMSYKRLWNNICRKRLRTSINNMMIRFRIRWTRWQIADLRNKWWWVRLFVRILNIWSIMSIRLRLIIMWIWCKIQECRIICRGLIIIHQLNLLRCKTWLMQTNSETSLNKEQINLKIILKTISMEVNNSLKFKMLIIWKNSNKLKITHNFWKNKSNKRTITNLPNDKNKTNSILH